MRRLKFTKAVGARGRFKPRAALGRPFPPCKLTVGGWPPANDDFGLGADTPSRKPCTFIRMPNVVPSRTILFMLAPITEAAKHAH